MLSNFLKGGAVLGGGYAAYASVSTMLSSQQGTATEDMGVLGESTGMGLARGMFGGENLLLNVGAEFGGKYASGQLRTASRKQYAGRRTGQSSTMRGLGFHDTGSGYVSNRKKRHKLGATRGARMDPGNAADAYIDSRGRRPGRKGASASAYTNSRKALTRNAAKVGKLGRQVRRFSKVAAWAPLAFMAFDMVSSLGNMEAPSTNAIPRRSAAMSGTFHDTSMAHTQRQRAMQAMHESQYSGRSALGNEASLMHR